MKTLYRQTMARTRSFVLCISAPAEQSAHWACDVGVRGTDTKVPGPHSLASMHWPALTVKVLWPAEGKVWLLRTRYPKRCVTCQPSCLVPKRTFGALCAAPVSCAGGLRLHHSSRLAVPHRIAAVLPSAGLKFSCVWGGEAGVREMSGTLTQTAWRGTRGAEASIYLAHKLSTQGCSLPLHRFLKA